MVRGETNMRVFISHSSKDKPAVEQLAIALNERGVVPWLDKWEIGPGDDIVAKINDGLDTANAGLIVFSKHSEESRWVEAEVSYLTYARIKEGKVLIPVVAGDNPFVPALLRPLARCGIDEVDAIVDALLHRRAGPPPARSAAVGLSERVTVTLLRQGSEGVQVKVRIGGQDFGEIVHTKLPRSVVSARDDFLQGFRTGLRRGPAEAERLSLERGLAELGRVLRDFCLPPGAGEALASLIDGCPLGTVVEVYFEADDPQFLGLPFEALRLPDDRLLATLPSVVTLRRPARMPATSHKTLAGPIKILVAVGAPDEDRTSAVVLDMERELQNILNAVEEAQRLENVEVRILEIGHPAVIADAIERDAYHVLHVSCHGMPGRLELEDEDGGAVSVTANELLEPIKRTGRPLPMVFLNTCHGGVEEGQTASFSEELLRAGVPCILAMQTSVSDYYATELALTFYKHLRKREPALASRALADARRDIEQARLKAIQTGASLDQTQPEYATAALYIAGEESPLADFSLDKEPLQERPVYELVGPVPQLLIGDLIGRRREMRETLRTLRGTKRDCAGVILTGLGGVGKSAVAGRVMRRMSEGGWLVASHQGRFNIQAIAASIAAALATSTRRGSGNRAAILKSIDLDDLVRLQCVAQALAEEPLLLVLDDFEQNFPTGGGAFLDPDTALYFEHIVRNVRCGRLLVTSRHPIPGGDTYLREIPVGPLSPAETRKLLQRLPGLRSRSDAELIQVLRFIGGHPRMLEFLDALLRDGKGRLPHVTEKLLKTLEGTDLDLTMRPADLGEGLKQTLLLGARDVLLGELVDIARTEGIDEVLFQTAVSNLPISPAGLAHILGAATAIAVEPAISRLLELSLLYRFHDGHVWIHRWTAEGLAGLQEQDVHRGRCNRAGHYRIWRLENEQGDLDEAVEAVRNFLAGQDFDAAAQIVKACFDVFRNAHQSVRIAALASEVLESLPIEHPAYPWIADEEAQAHVMLGLTKGALDRYHRLLDFFERLAQAEPDRSDYQRDLSVSYERLGDLYRALGEGEKAREYFLKALDIAERLAQAEPDRSDYQVDLAVSLAKVGMNDNRLKQEYLGRSLTILVELQNRGRLLPRHESMIIGLRNLMSGD